MTMTMSSTETSSGSGSSDAPQFLAPSVPSACPVCGAYSLAPDASVSILLAVCDVLVVKALERLGNFLLREPRKGRSEARIQRLGTRPKFLGHTLWQTDDFLVDKALRGAWDVVPVILTTHQSSCEYDASKVIALLDAYVHDLAITGTPHDIDELAYRLHSRLDLPVYRTHDHEKE